MEKLTQAAQAELANAVAFFEDCPPANATIAGHTATAGDAADNLALSEQRAQAVKQFLVDQGIAADRLAVEALGETQPIMVDGVEDVGASNRVEFLSTLRPLPETSLADVGKAVVVLLPRRLVGQWSTVD